MVKHKHINISTDLCIDALFMSFICSNSCMIEIITRKQGDFDAEHVLDVLMSFDSEEGAEIKREFVRRNLADYPFVIVMSAGERNLKEVMDQEQFVYVSQNQQTQNQIKRCVDAVMSALQHVHEKGYSHGDIKVTSYKNMCFERSVILILLNHNRCILL